MDKVGVVYLGSVIGFYILRVRKFVHKEAYRLASEARDLAIFAFMVVPGIEISLAKLFANIYALNDEMVYVNILLAFVLVSLLCVHLNFVEFFKVILAY